MLKRGSPVHPTLHFYAGIFGKTVSDVIDVVRELGIQTCYNRAVEELSVRAGWCMLRANSSSDTANASLSAFRTFSKVFLPANRLNQPPGRSDRGPV